MNKKLFLGFFTLLIHTIYVQNIVFIHIGRRLPKHLKRAIHQARLFNKKCDIYLLANENALVKVPSEITKLNTICISLEKLTKTPEHITFIKKCREKEPFWRYTSERFLYLHDFITAYNLSHVFHLESDVMLYINVEDLTPIFDKLQANICGTFDCDKRCVPGFTYFRDQNAIQQIAHFFERYGHRIRVNFTDMHVIGLCKNKNPDLILTLPIIPSAYTSSYPLKSRLKQETKNPSWYSNDEFQCIFDAAALGQYLGGLDPVHRNSKPGFINESCLFNPSYLTYVWEKDKEGRNVPYACFEGKKWRIANLHIHSKNLLPFAS